MNRFEEADDAFLRFKEYIVKNSKARVDIDHLFGAEFTNSNIRMYQFVNTETYAKVKIIFVGYITGEYDIFFEHADIVSLKGNANFLMSKLGDKNE